MAPVPAEAFTEKFKQIGNVPTLPAAATRALAIVNDPKCSVRDFSRVIEADPALATSLLKLVNSSYYAANTKISNLTMAITRLGLRETQNLILAVSVRSVFRWMPKDQHEARDRLWRHSGLTGVLCRQTNEKLGLGFSGEEFAAGLAHDLGRIMLAVGYPDVFQKIGQKKIINEDLLIEEERRLLGFTHADLGAWLTSMWQLPPELTEAIQYHHNPSDAPQHQVLAAIVNIAESMANHMEETHSIEGVDLVGNQGWKMLCSQWSNIGDLDVGLFATAVMMDAAPEAEALALVDLSA